MIDQRPFAILVDSGLTSVRTYSVSIAAVHSSGEIHRYQLTATEGMPLGVIEEWFNQFQYSPPLRELLKLHQRELFSALLDLP